MGVTAEIGDREVATIVMCDPSGRNALDARLRQALADELLRLQQHDGVRAIVIAAETGNFSVGGDLSQIADHVAGQEAYRTMFGPPTRLACGPLSPETAGRPP